MDDRRESPRIPLDAPCLLTLLVNREEEHTVMLVDVSRGGAQLALSPVSDLAAITPGAPVTFTGVPAPLDSLLEGAHGKVAWIGLRSCGIRLAKELPVDATAITDLTRL